MFEPHRSSDNTRGQGVLTAQDFPLGKQFHVFHTASLNHKQYMVGPGNFCMYSELWVESDNESLQQKNSFKCHFHNKSLLRSFRISQTFSVKDPNFMHKKISSWTDSPSSVCFLSFGTFVFFCIIVFLYYSFFHYCFFVLEKGQKISDNLKSRDADCWRI